MPILDETGACVGLVDAESWTPGFFDEARVAVVTRCALDLAQEMTQVQPVATASSLSWQRVVAGLCSPRQLGQCSLQ